MKHILFLVKKKKERFYKKRKTRNNKRNLKVDDNLISYKSCDENINKLLLIRPKNKFNDCNLKIYVSFLKALKSFGIQKIKNLRVINKKKFRDTINENKKC